MRSSPSRKKQWPALKHGAYTTTEVLPGEDPAAYAKLQKDLIAEFAPNGAFEKGIVADLTRLIWRKRNLATFRIAELARERAEQIKRIKVPQPVYVDPTFMETTQTWKIANGDIIVEAHEAAETQARAELGQTYALVELGDLLTLDRQSQELQVEERLDAMIDKCLKRLLYVRGLKSMAISPERKT